MGPGRCWPGSIREYFYHLPCPGPGPLLLWPQLFQEPPPRDPHLYPRLTFCSPIAVPLLFIFFFFPLLFLKYKSDHNIPLMRIFNGSLVPSRPGLWIPEAFRDWPLLTSLASLALSTFCSAQPDQGLPQCSTSLLTSSPLPGTLCLPPFHWLTTTYSLGPSLKATSSWKPSGTARLCWAPLFSVPSVPCISIIRHLSFHFLSVFSSISAVGHALCQGTIEAESFTFKPKST